MTRHHFEQIGLLSIEATVVAALIIGLYRARKRLGLGALFIALGTFQYLQVVSALSLYVEIMPGFVVSPGSVVLFSASIAAVLLVYVREDVAETRRLVYGLVIANVALSCLGFLFGLHLGRPTTFNIFGLPDEFFFQDPRILFIGTLVLYFDVLLVVLIYEWLSRKVRWLYIRISGALLAVLTFDTVFFVTGAFFERENYASLLASGIAGKAIAALFYSVVLTVFLQQGSQTDRSRTRARLPFADLFRSLALARQVEALSEQGERYELAVRGSRSSILDWNLVTGHIDTDPNWSSLLHLEHLERSTTVAGFLDRIHVDDRAGFEVALDDHLSGKTSTLETDLRLQSGDGSFAWLHLRTQVVPDDRGTAARLSGVLTDISDRKRLEALKANFISVAGHELRTPLTSLYGAVRLLLRGATELSPPNIKLLDMIERNTLRLNRLIDDLLDLERTAQGKLELRLATLDSASQLHDVCREMKGYLDQFGASIKTLVPDNLLIRGDADRLQQVLRNLISNAAKHSPEGAEIVVEAIDAGDMVRFEVRDKGPGIPTELHPVIFDSFTRASPSGESGPVRSSGLGLSIAKGIVEAHGGTIGFETELEVGTTFYFIVPGARGDVCPPAQGPA